MVVLAPMLESAPEPAPPAKNFAILVPPLAPAPHDEPSEPVFTGSGRLPPRIQSKTCNMIFLQYLYLLFLGWSLKASLPLSLPAPSVSLSGSYSSSTVGELMESLWHTSKAWPTVLTILIAWLCNRKKQDGIKNTFVPSNGREAQGSRAGHILLKCRGQ